MDHETIWDQRLRIETGGRDETNADQYHHPYEPTPYTVLERLADSGLVGSDDVVVDYGCGKGRVGFFLSQRTGRRPLASNMTRTSMKVRWRTGRPPFWEGKQTSS